MISDWYCWLDFGSEPSIIQSRQRCCGCKDVCKETGGGGALCIQGTKSGPPVPDGREVAATQADAMVRHMIEGMPK